MSILKACLVVMLFNVTAFSQDPAQDNQLEPQQAPPATLTPQQLESMVAPVALYPDPLLSQVLVAAQFPLQVVEADQFLRLRPYLTGTDLVAAVKDQGWDASVQGLAAFPQVLQLLSEDVRWTTNLGNAFASQQADVMSAVQRLRSSAVASGKLQADGQQQVEKADDSPGAPIVIEPADPGQISVPDYDPNWLWGPAADAYPLLDYPTAGLVYDTPISLDFFFGGSSGWGWAPNWRSGSVVVNVPVIQRLYRVRVDGRISGPIEPERHPGDPNRSRGLERVARFNGPNPGSNAGSHVGSSVSRSFVAPTSKSEPNASTTKK